MLSLYLRRGDLEAGWRATPAGFACRGSHVHPLRHGALEEIVVTCGARLLVCVRERGAGLTGPEQASGARPEPLAEVDPERFERLASDLPTWPLQWHQLIVDGDDGAAGAATSRRDRVLATLEAGPWGTALIFVIADGAGLRADWDAYKLLPHVRRTSVDPVLAARYLAEYDTPYARNTLFDGLRLVTDRARATWREGPADAGALTIAYPESCRRPNVSALRPDADPVGAFDSILTSSLRRWTPVADGVWGTELSGGFDSGIVAAAAASLAPLRSYGIALIGPSAADQRERRNELVAHLGLDDTEIPIDSFLPLAPDSCRLNGSAPVLPWEETYYEATDALVASARASGVEVMLTGFGGDELCTARASELEPCAARQPDVVETAPAFLTTDARATLSEPVERSPQAASCESAIGCAASSAPRYLRHGIWPVHPLCTPELVHFCARLPRSWRTGRTIERKLLARYGCTARVTRPRVQDDFSHALEASIRGVARPLLERLFANSVLAEQGIVDTDRLLRGYAAWCEHGSRDEAVRFFAASVMELCLAGMC